MNRKNTILLILSLAAISILLVFAVNRTHLFAKKPDLTISENDIVIGQADAPTTIFLYHSYTCKYCKKFFIETFPLLKKQKIDKGQVKLVVKMICQSEQKDMLRAVQTAWCLQKFGKWDKYHQLLLHNINVVYSEEFNQLIEQYIYDNPDIAQCIIENNDYEDLKRNYYEFKQNNFTGTPTFVIDGKVFYGFKSYDELIEIIN